MCKLCRDNDPPHFSKTKKNIEERVRVRSIIHNYIGEYPCAKAMRATMQISTRGDRIDKYIIDRLIRIYSKGVGGRKACDIAASFFCPYTYNTRARHDVVQRTIERCIIERKNNNTGYTIYAVKTTPYTKKNYKDFRSLNEAIQYRDSIKESK